MSGAFIGRLTVLVTIALQSPFMVTKSGAGLAPVQVITKFVVDSAKKEGGELSDQARTFVRVVNWPAHMFEECVIRRMAKLEGNCDTTFVWERAVSHASKPVAFWEVLPEQNKQILLMGCVITTVGALMSFLAGRTHILSVLGGLTLGYGIFMNGLTPTFQYVVCVLIALFGLRSRARASAGFASVPVPAKKAAAPPPKAAGKGASKKSN
jgi:hypothetical protein